MIFGDPLRQAGPDIVCGVLDLVGCNYIAVSHNIETKGRDSGCYPSPAVMLI